jgi:hypothetical protein
MLIDAKVLACIWNASVRRQEPLQFFDLVLHNNDARGRSCSVGAPTLIIRNPWGSVNGDCGEKIAGCRKWHRRQDGGHEERRPFDEFEVESMGLPGVFKAVARRNGAAYAVGGLEGALVTEAGVSLVACVVVGTLFWRYVPAPRLAGRKHDVDARTVPRPSARPQPPSSRWVGLITMVRCPSSGVAPFDSFTPAERYVEGADDRRGGRYYPSPFCATFSASMTGPAGSRRRM